MPHLGTLTHQHVPHARSPWLERIVMIAIGLALGAASVVAVDAVRTDSDLSGTATAADAPVVASTAGANHEDFVRLNTTELGWAVSPTQDYVVESSARVDPFIYINTTALEYPPRHHADPFSGPR